MVGSVLIPSLRYKDARAAIAWLERAFGFERHALYDGPEGTVAHAELRLGTGMIMVGVGVESGAVHADVCDAGGDWRTGDVSDVFGCGGMARRRGSVPRPQAPRW